MRESLDVLRLSHRVNRPFRREAWANAPLRVIPESGHWGLGFT